MENYRHIYKRRAYLRNLPEIRYELNHEVAFIDYDFTSERPEAKLSGRIMDCISSLFNKLIADN